MAGTHRGHHDVLIVGGHRVGGDIAPAEVWDPTTASVSPAGSLAERRANHSATLLPDGRVLVVGGGDPREGLALAEVWSPAIDEPLADAEATVAAATDPLPGVDLVTEEVEPGVYRVLDDGAGHDLGAEPPRGVSVAPDDSVWLLRASQDPVVGRTTDPATAELRGAEYGGGALWVETEIGNRAGVIDPE